MSYGRYCLSIVVVICTSFVLISCSYGENDGGLLSRRVMIPNKARTLLIVSLAVCAAESVDEQSRISTILGGTPNGLPALSSAFSRSDPPVLSKNDPPRLI
jgi:hypothetical protein